MKESEAQLTIEEFTKERDAAFMSLDEQTIRAYQRKWNQREMPSDMNVFWGSVHKAITGATTLPIEFRRKSKKWLDERHLRSLDDGEL